MNMLQYKIVADSSSDVLTLEHIAFASAPLKIITAKKEYTDDAALDTEQMVEDLAACTEKSSTACPSVGDWLDAFGEAEYVFCLTITSALSGSYNSAVMAKDAYENANPGRRVLVIDTLSTGPEMKLLIERLQALILEEHTFDEICGRIAQYQQKLDLIFVLESVKNLANNGRFSHLAAKAVGILGLSLIGKASEDGRLELHSKCRGKKKAVAAALRLMQQAGYSGGKVRIGHCMNETAAQTLKALVLEQYPDAEVEYYPCRGLCCFYAEAGGFIVGFETV